MAPRISVIRCRKGCVSDGDTVNKSDSLPARHEPIAVGPWGRRPDRVGTDLFRPAHVTTVDAKICGLSTADAMESALAAGARYVGFVFYEPSPRHVVPEQAAGLAKAASAVEKVAVMVDPGDDLIADVTAKVGVDLLQLHGAEDPSRVAAIRRTFGVPVMKAVPVSSEEDLMRARAYEHTADMLLFDAKPPAAAEGVLPGGNALRFDWTLLRDRTWACPWMLSGGLTAENISEAVSVSGARRVDVSSGVESSPGEKDPVLITRFLAAVARVEA